MAEKSEWELFGVRSRFDPLGVRCIVFKRNFSSKEWPSSNKNVWIENLNEEIRFVVLEDMGSNIEMLLVFQAWGDCDHKSVDKGVFQ